MKLSKIFAGLSAAALAATMLAMPASAEEEAATKKAYNFGINIQFGHIKGGTVTATAKGSGVLNTFIGEDGTITTDGTKTGETKMMCANDWTGAQSMVPVDNLEILDGTNDPDNPGWNGMWIQCFTESLDDFEITFDFDLSGTTWKDMDPADPEFTGWIIVNAPSNAASTFPEIAQHVSMENTATTYSCTLDSAGIKTLIDEGIITKVDEANMVDVPDPDAQGGSDSSADSKTDSTSDSKTDSKTDSTASSTASSSTTSSSASTTSSKAAGGSTGTSTTSKTTSSAAASSAASDATESPEAGAAAGIALALAAVAGAAVVVSKKR